MSSPSSRSSSGTSSPPSVKACCRCAKSFGIFVGGWPGIGKTPFAKIWGQLLGQYWVDARNPSNRKPCWRRDNNNERFRSKPPELCEMLLLDDANLSQADVEEWKWWFDLTQSGSGDGRYSDAQVLPECAEGHAHQRGELHR